MKSKTKKKHSDSDSIHSEGDGSPSFRKTSRENGWSCPWHPFMFIEWIFIIYFCLIYFGCIVPVFPYEWQPAGYIIPGIVMLFHFVVQFISITIDPADPATQRNSNDRTVPRFDRTKYPHVIENCHCYLCEVDVSPTSKHCSACNKCVLNFDHHCKWLNNCVGSKNYRFFISTIASGLIASLLVLTASAYAAIVYWVDPSLLYPDCVAGTTSVINAVTTGSSYNSTLASTVAPTETTTLPPPYCDDQTWLRDNLKLFTSVPGLAFFIVMVLTAVLAVIAVGLLGHLVLFHLYLICKNLTTYEYIVRKRDEDKSRNDDVETGLGADVEPPKMRKIKKSQVVPTKGEPSSREEIEMKKTVPDVFQTQKLEDTADTLDYKNYERALEEQEKSTQPEKDNGNDAKSDTETKEEDKSQAAGAAAVAETKTKKKKGKKKKKGRKRRSSLPSDRTPLTNMEEPWGPHYSTQLNLSSSLPQSELEHQMRYKPYGIPPGAGGLNYTPRGYQPMPIMSHPTYTQPPPRPQPPPPPAINIAPAGPAADYHSSSAESLHEIPVSQIRQAPSVSTSMNASPRYQPNASPGYQPNASPGYQPNSNPGYHPNHYGRISPLSLVSSHDGSVARPHTRSSLDSIPFATKTLPHNKHEVPPLDFSNLRDTPSMGAQSGRSTSTKAKSPKSSRRSPSVRDM